MLATDAAPVGVTDASVAADYVASMADYHQPETTRAWSLVVEDVRQRVQREIEASGSFVVQGKSGAFVCE